MKMSFIGFSCLLCSFIVSAQPSESQVFILRDYDDLVLGHADKASAVEVEHKHQAISPNYISKRPRRQKKKTILHYGRHIYHLDNFDNLKELRSKKMAHLKPDSIAYDYIDINELIRSTGTAKSGKNDYLKDLYILSDKPLRMCNDKQCNEDLRKFSKKKRNKNDDETHWKHKKVTVGRMKRFQIVSNRNENPTTSSEDYHKKKRKQRKKQKKKKKHSSESAETSSESWEINKKKKYKSSEESVEIKKKPKKHYVDHSSASASFEKWKNHNEDLKSSEEFHNTKKKKRKKKRHVGSAETKRKTFVAREDYYMQGNKIYHTKQGRSKKKRDDFDKRRRLEHFMPKRYHWNPSDFHNLGYFWFNGPKGLYAEPRPLSI